MSIPRPAQTSLFDVLQFADYQEQLFAYFFLVTVPALENLLVDLVSNSASGTWLESFGVEGAQGVTGYAIVPTQGNGAQIPLGGEPNRFDTAVAAPPLDRFMCLSDRSINVTAATPGVNRSQAYGGQVTVVGAVGGIVVMNPFGGISRESLIPRLYLAPGNMFRMGTSGGAGLTVTGHLIWTERSQVYR